MVSSLSVTGEVLKSPVLGGAIQHICSSPRWRSEQWSDNVYRSGKLFWVKRWEEGRAIKVITNVESLPCREWLRKCRLSSLEKRLLGSRRALQTVNDMEMDRDWPVTVLSSTRRKGHQVKWGVVSSIQTKRSLFFLQWVKGRYKALPKIYFHWRLLNR